MAQRRFVVVSRARSYPAQSIVGGTASGEALVLEEPLSLWGGLDPTSGIIIDQHHPQRGTCISDTVLVMASGRGSSSASSILVEAARLGTAPAGIVLREVDHVLTVGALVAKEVYTKQLPITIVGSEVYEQLRSGDRLRLGPDLLSIDR